MEIRPEGKKSALNNIIFILVVIVLLSIAFVSFFYQVNQNFKETSKNAVLMEARKTRDLIEDKIKNKFSELESIANIVATFDDLSNTQLNHIINEQKKYNDNYAISVLWKESITPENIFSNANALAISTAFKGINSITMEINLQGENTGNIIMAVPIFKDGNIVGILHTKYKAEQFFGVFRTATFDGSGSINIICRGAELSAYNIGANKGENFRMQISGCSKTGQTLICDMNSGKEGVGTFLWDNKQYFIGYVPIYLSDWYLMISVPVDFVTKQYNEISQIGMSFMLSAVFIFLFILTYVSWCQNKNAHKLRQTKKELEVLTANVPGGIFTHTSDEAAEFGFISEGLLNIFGYTESEFRQVTKNSFYNMIYEPDRLKIIDKIHDMNEKNVNKPMEYRICTKDGTIRWLYDSAQCISDDKGRSWLYVVVVDTTKQHADDMERIMNEARYRMIVEKSDSIIYEWYFEDDRVVVSDVWNKKLGYTLPPEHFFSHLFKRGCVHTEDTEKLIDLLDKISHGEPYGEAIIRIRKRMGDEYIWMKTCFMCIFNSEGEPAWGMGISIDIDGQMRQANDFRKMAERDFLTGMFNRRAAEIKIRENLSLYPEDRQCFIVLDVDNFKEVNDNLGHIVGDNVLVQVASVLQDSFQANGILGRLGGDEFVLFLKTVPPPEEFNNKLMDICNSIHGYNGLDLSVSMGVAIFPEDAKSYEQLYEKADKALYFAKDSGKNTYCIYNETMEQ